MFEFSEVIFNERFKEYCSRPCPLVVSPLLLHQVKELRERLMETLLKHVIADVVQHRITVAVESMTK